MRALFVVPIVALSLSLLSEGVRPSVRPSHGPVTTDQTHTVVRLGCRHLPFSVCFAPGTDPDYAQDVVAAMEDDAEFEDFRASDSSRWSRTATDGGGLTRGQPITLTWAVVPDGTAIRARSGGTAGTSNLRSRLNGIYGSESVWRAHFEDMFERWSEVTGITYVRETADDRATLASASGSLGVRADIRIGGQTIDGNSGVLAYNYFPNNGDMVIDTADSFFSNTSSNSRRLRNVLAHEHGHGLGMSHVCPVNRSKLMEPFATTAFDGPQHDDILAGQRLYGDRFGDNDSATNAADLGRLGAETVIVDEVSLDGANESDWFAFGVTGRLIASVTLIPVGEQYDEGSQGSSGCGQGSPTDSRDNRNLALALLDTDGLTVLASADVNAAAGPERLQNLTLPATSGRYHVRVSGSGPDEVQLYRLEIQLAAEVGVPNAADDVAQTNEDEATIVDVLANDAGLEDTPLRLTLVTPPSSGTASVTNDDQLSYAPLPNFHGTDVLTYRIRDKDGQSSEATLTLNVRAVNDAPVARDDDLRVIEGIGTLIDVRTNDTDLDGDPLSVSIVEPPTSGSALLRIDGAVQYAPGVDSPETDTFTYRVSDGRGGTSTARVRITIGPNWRAGNARIDADGDQFPDDLEQALGTQPGNPTSRPGTSPAGTLPTALDVRHLVLRLHRKHPERDEVELRGRFPLPEGSDPDDLDAALYVGGVVVEFDTSEESSDRNRRLLVAHHEPASRKARRKNTAATQFAEASFSVRIRRADLAAQWIDEGLSAQPSRRTRQQEITIYLVIDGRAFEATIPLKGRVGRARRFAVWRMR